jgi:hypothetical protein
LAVDTLTGRLGVLPSERVLIHEEEDEPPRGWFATLWERLLV